VIKLDGGPETWYADDVTQRGWLLLAPELYRPGNSWHVAVTEVQHRLMELIEEVCRRYAVDRSRIYVMGQSGGGYRSILMAAKYPHFFAAAVDLKGPMDMAQWYREDRSGIPGQPCTGQHRKPLCDETGVREPYGSSGGPQYERFSALFNDVDGLVRNLKHVPVAILHNTGYDTDPQGMITNYSTVYLSHARELAAALQYWGSDDAPFYREFPGSHTDDPSRESQIELMGWLASQRLDTQQTHLILKVDESKSYYWLSVQQEARADWRKDSPWTELDVSYDHLASTISAVVTDSMRTTLSFDLADMGLQPALRYVVEERDLRSGALVLNFAQPLGMTLTASTSEGGEHELLIYPESPERCTGIRNQAQDTFLELWSPTTNNALAQTLRITQGDRLAPLIRFDVSDLPAHTRLHSAAIRVYVTGKAGTTDPVSLTVESFQVNRAWVDSQANWQQAQSGMPWSVAGCNGLGATQDRQGWPASSVSIAGINRWYSLDVTDLVQGWIEDPAQNHGVVLKNNHVEKKPWHFEIASTEYADESKRPQLYLVYDCGGLTPTATPSVTPSSTWMPTDTPTLTPSATATSSATASRSPSPTPTWTRTPTSPWTATPTATPTATQGPGPTATATRALVCVGWETLWGDEFDESALSGWQSDLGQGTASVQASALRMDAPSSGSDRFPLLWARVSAPDSDYVLELRFRWHGPTAYGTSIGLGSALYDGSRHSEGSPPPAGISDVLRIHHSSAEFGITLFDQLTWSGAAQDTAWHVLQMAREGSIYDLSLDGKYMGSVLQGSRFPRSIFLGSPTIMSQSGPWSALEVDYVLVRSCIAWGSNRLWLPVLLRGAGS